MTMLALAAVATGVCSCAYLLHGDTEEIAVNSEPMGADVSVSNGATGVTPFTIEVPRERDLVFHFSKPGYQSADVVDGTQVQSKYIAADWASMLLTAIPVAWISDVSSGSAHSHEQTIVEARLTPDQSKVVHPPPERPATLVTPSPLPTPSIDAPADEN